MIEIKCTQPILLMNKKKYRQQVKEAVEKITALTIVEFTFLSDAVARAKEVLYPEPKTRKKPEKTQAKTS